MDRIQFLKTALEFEEKGVPYVAITLVETRGHAPQDIGAKAIITVEGLAFGTVGGGKVEAKAIGVAQELLADASRVWCETHWNLQADVGMTCGGTVKLVFEAFRPPHWNVVIFGAGHVAQALVRILVPLRARLTCIDPRAEWVERLPVSPNLRAAVGGEDQVDALVAAMPEQTFYIVMTQGHATDLPILKRILGEKKFSFLGCIGSKVKAIRLKAGLKELGLDPERLHCPIGFEVGNNSPHEIAISVAAQLLAVRDELDRGKQSHVTAN